MKAYAASRRVAGAVAAAAVALGLGLLWLVGRRPAPVAMVRCPIHGIAYDPHRERRGEMSGTPTLFCRTCNAFRAIEDWHERGEALVIELEPCGHVLHRNAGVEWPIRRAA